MKELDTGTPRSHRLEVVLGMDTRYDNQVYVVALGAGNPDGWSLSWIVIDELVKHSFGIVSIVVSRLNRKRANLPPRPVCQRHAWKCDAPETARSKGWGGCRKGDEDFGRGTPPGDNRRV